MVFLWPCDWSCRCVPTLHRSWHFHSEKCVEREEWVGPSDTLHLRFPPKAHTSPLLLFFGFILILFLFVSLLGGLFLCQRVPMLDKEREGGSTPSGLGYPTVSSPALSFQDFGHVHTYLGCFSSHRRGIQNAGSATWDLASITTGPQGQLTLPCF